MRMRQTRPVGRTLARRGRCAVSAHAALTTDAAAVAEVAALFDNPLERLFGSGDGDLPGWVPPATFFAYLWVRMMERFRKPCLPGRPRATEPPSRDGARTRRDERVRG